MSLTPELQKLKEEIEGYARGFGLDFFDVIFELVDSEQVNSIAALGGFPVRYPHWRFGMDYDQLSKNYEWGFSKIYELVINTDPSYAYLVKANPTVDQKLVMAHVYGHVDFFKNNYWFSKTDRKMLDRMANNAVRIRNYMDRYGQDTVENFIDWCLSIENLIDPFLPFQSNKGTQKTAGEDGADVEAEAVGRFKNDRPYMESFINPKEFIEERKQKASERAKQSKRNPAEPQKDVLAFLLQNAPLEEWQYEVLNVIRDEAYYFVPQMQTKIMNEGWASYWHSKILTEKALKDSEILDFARVHSGAMQMQPGQINPYKIGIELFRDIEDRWNRGAFGKEYEECQSFSEKLKWDKKLGKGREKIFEVRRIYNDVTFIDAYLTPEFVDRYQMYTYEFNRRTNRYEIVDRDFKNIKEKLLSSLANRGQPEIYVKDGNFQNRGELLLLHKFQGLEIDLKWARLVMSNLSRIWGRPVCLETRLDEKPHVYRFSDGHFEDLSKKEESSD